MASINKTGLRQNFVNGQKFTAEMFNTLVNRIDSIIDALDALGDATGVNIQVLSQSEYDALVAANLIDANVIYIVKNSL